MAQHRSTLGLAPDQQRRARQGHRQRLARRQPAGGGASALLLLQIGAQRFGQRLAGRRWLAAMVRGQHLAKALVGRQTGGVVAAQVVQAHQLAVVAFLLIVQGQQLMGGLQRGVKITGGFTLGELAAQRVLRPALAGLALLQQPAGKVLAILKRQLAQQRRLAARRIGLEGQIGGQ